jgi:GDP-mannose 6-dehydrogenase
MNVSVFGLGYVGSVSAASFAADGHTVIGVDVNPDKWRASMTGAARSWRRGSTS